LRRLTAAAFLLVACAAGVAMTGARGGGPETYRVDALFYNAAHLIPGQLVKIAGAEVGSVEDVRLTGDRRARVQMKIDARFAPFRTDARCRIRPQSLIGEKFVQCDPGSAQARELRGRDGGAPTVPLARNEVPVDLDLVFASLRMPYRQRLALIVNELGTGLAGRPRELNDAIRLANPALGETRRVLEILDSDRARLGRLIDASDQVIAELARRRGDVQDFIARAGQVGDAVASRRGDLDLALRRLPPMLGELEPAAADLASLSREARPVVADLREAAPGVRALAADLGPLNDAARPALVRLADMSGTGRRAVRAATPVAELLKPVTRGLRPVAVQARALLESMRERGVVEGLQGYAYFGALATARFDRYSHILPSYQIGLTCNLPAKEPAPGCDAHFAGRAGEAERKRRRRLADRRPQTAEVGSGQMADGRGGSAANPGPVTRHPSPVTPESPPTPAPPSTPVDQFLDFLLGP
jgi:ABC-type transporter Mla subunit MlaD